MNPNILEQYAISRGHNPKKLLDDYFDSSEEEQMELMSHVMQTGGNSQEQQMQIVQLFAQKTGTPVEEIVAQLQQMSAKEQNAALSQMAQSLEEQSPEVAQDGFDSRSLLGYSDNSPYKYDTSNLIKSNQISMANTGIDLMGISDTGDMQYMPAYSGKYEFDGNEVTEYPVYQTGPKPSYYERLVSRPDYNEYLSLKSNQKLGYGSSSRLTELAKTYESPNFLKAEKIALKKAPKVTLTNEVVKKITGKPKISFTKKELKELAESISDKPATSAITQNNNINNYGTKIAVKDPALYEKILQAKKVQAINKGIEATKASRNYSQVVPETFSLKKLTNQALEQMSGGSKAVLDKLKALKISTPDITMKSLKEAIPNINLGNVGKVLGKGLVGLEIAGYANKIYNDLQNFDSPDYVLTDRGLEKKSDLGIPPTVVTKSNQNVTVKGKNKTYNLKYDRDYNGTSLFNDDYGNRWVKDKNGAFKIIHSPENNNSEVVSPAKTNVRYTGPKSKTTTTKPEVIADVPKRIDFGNVDTVAPKTIPQIETRFNKTATSLAPATIQYSPKIEGITPERAPAKSQYKFNTSSPLGDLINNFKVAKSFEAIDLPYMQEVDARMPEGIKYDPRPGLQSINEQFSAYKQGINPNSATGQAVLASLSGKQEAASMQFLNNLQQQQAQADYQTQVNRADLYNKIVAQRNANAANYTDGVLRANANRDAIIDSTLTNMQQLQANKQLQENAYEQMLAFNANVDDESGVFDKLLGRKKFSFNKDKAYVQNFGV